MKLYFESTEARIYILPALEDAIKVAEKQKHNTNTLQVGSVLYQQREILVPLEQEKILCLE